MQALIINHKRIAQTSIGHKLVRKALTFVLFTYSCRMRQLGFVELTLFYLCHFQPQASYA